MIAYALVADDATFAIDLWPSREDAEEALRQVLVDEPAFADLLRIELIDLGSAAAPARPKRLRPLETRPKRTL